MGSAQQIESDAYGIVPFQRSSYHKCAWADASDICDLPGLDGSNRELKPEVAILAHHFQLACRFAKTTEKDQISVCRFGDCDGSSAEFVLVAHHCHGVDARFEATCFAMRPTETFLASGCVASGLVGRPRRLLNTVSQGVAAIRWPQTLNEHRVVTSALGSIVALGDYSSHRSTCARDQACHGNCAVAVSARPRARGRG